MAASVWPRAWLALVVVALALPALAPTVRAADDPKAKADQLALLVNRARVAEGLRPLARNPALDRAAEEHSRDMVAHRYLDHTAPDGSEPMDRAIRAGYGARPGTGWIVVEIISAISSDPEGPLNWWLNESPSVHGRVLRSPRWREVGVGYAAGGEYGNYWTLLVGCQPGVVPSVTLDGRTFQHVEECDSSAPPRPAAPTATALPTPSPTPPARPYLMAATPGPAELDVHWFGLPAPASSDWLGLYRPGDPAASYLLWSYLTCGAGQAAGAAGHCRLSLPPLPAGQYELRLYRGGFDEVVRSDAIALAGAPRLTLGAGAVRAGERLAVSWQGLAPARPRDWLGLYPAGRSDRPAAAWAYVSCLAAPDAPRPDGACDLTVPPGLEPGPYELRLFPDDGLVPLAAAPVAVLSP